MGAHKQLKTLLPTLRGRSGNDGSYNNLFNFKSIVTQFYTQSVPSDRYALSRTRALWCHVPSTCLMHVSDSHCHLHGVKDWISISTPPLFPLSPQPRRDSHSYLFSYPLPIPRKSHLHSVSSYAMGNWNWLVPRKDSRNPLMIRCASQLHLLLLPTQEKGIMSCPLSLGHKVIMSSLFSHPALSTDLLHTAGLAPLVTEDVCSISMRVASRLDFPWKITSVPEWYCYHPNLKGLPASILSRRQPSTSSKDHPSTWCSISCVLVALGPPILITTCPSLPLSTLSHWNSDSWYLTIKLMASGHPPWPPQMETCFVLSPR